MTGNGLWLALMLLASMAAATVFDWAALAKDLERRQNFVGTGVTPSSSVPMSSDSSFTSPASSTSDQLSSSLSSTSDTSSVPITSTPGSTSTPSSTPTPTSSSFSSTDSSTSTTPTPTSTPASSTPIVTTESQQFTTTVVTIDASGSPFTSLVISATPVTQTVGFASTTPSASLNSGSDSGSSGSGLSSDSKRIIGGVVGGVGGAIVLGALAFVAWRLWGKKGGQQVEDDYGYAPGTPGHAPSASVGTENTLGSTGLEKYDQPHRPAIASNPNTTTATNF